MKLSLITLSAILGNLAIATVPQTNVQPPTETQSLNTNQYLDKLQSNVRLVQAVKNNLNGVNIFKKLVEETKKLNDYSATYSSKVQNLVSGILPLILTAQDATSGAITGLHEWCSSADILVDAFLDDDTDDDLLKELSGSDSTTELVDKLKCTTDTLGSASSLVSTILTEFKSDFTEQSPLFEVLLSEELNNDENQRYPANLFKAIVKTMKKKIENPELLRQELSSINIVGLIGSAIGTDTNQQQRSQQLNNQRDDRENSTTKQAAEPSTIDPQRLIQFKNRVLTKFESTRKFFTDYKSSVDRTISSLDEMKAKFLGNNQREAIGPQSPLNNNHASVDAQLKKVAKALKTNCDSFTKSNLKNTRDGDHKYSSTQIELAISQH